jgi:uncharacterized protein (DUF2236 family)
VGATLQRLFGSDRMPGEQYHDPPGDPGLFGPDSVTWRVHADISMFVGGISALMLQTLHPLAAAAVAEHSRYREAPLQRLSRTASFVAATTYGSTAVADAAIAAVAAVHRRVAGVAPDGRPYSATDPALLTWIHVAEAHSFIRAHRRYCPFPVRGGEIDRYYAETAVVAERLGAEGIPRSRQEVGAYLERVRPELAAGEQAREMFAFLCLPLARHPATTAAHALLIQAAVGLLPGWAGQLHGVRQPPGWDRAVIRPATWTLLNMLRLTLGGSPVLDQARRRVQAGTGP